MEYLNPQLILKADDSGNDPTVYLGINQLVTKGYITDVSVMITFVGPYERGLLSEAIDKSPLREKPGIGIPLHINLVTGRPLSRPQDVPSLVDKDGAFYHPQPLRLAWKQYSNRVKPDEVRREIDAQIERYLRIFGHYPHALDSHNIILAVPPADEIAMQIAHELKIPLTYPKLYADRFNKKAPFFDILLAYPQLRDEYAKRGILSADWCFAEHWNKYPTLDESVAHLISALSALSAGVTELSFHPGHPDLIAQSVDSRFEGARVRDFNILTHPKVREILKTVTLTSYKELSNFKSNDKTPGYN